MRIDRNETIGHLAARHPHVVRLFESWGVDYCCSGHRSVGELCSMIGITVSELSMQVELSTPPVARVSAADKALKPFEIVGAYANRG